MQGSIAIPGSIGAVLVERPASIEEGFSQNSPIVYHYGHKTPGHNHVLFNQLVSRLADVVRERLVQNRKAEVTHELVLLLLPPASCLLPPASSSFMLAPRKSCS